MAYSERKHTRLQGYDYGACGMYFLTLCTQNKQSCLAQIVGCGILDAPLHKLTAEGNCVEKAIQFIGEIYGGVTVEKYVIMPNHVHLLVKLEQICKVDGASGKPHPTNARIPRLMSSLKRYTNRQIGRQIWQKSYHDHIIRNEADYLKIWNYIDINPSKWTEDCYYTR